MSSSDNEFYKEGYDDGYTRATQECQPTIDLLQSQVELTLKMLKDCREAREAITDTIGEMLS